MNARQNFDTLAASLAEEDPQPSPAAPPPTLSEVVALAQRLQDAGDIANADRAYEGWLAQGLRPGRHLALFNHGAILQATGQLARALAAYQEALALEPGFGQASINLGLLLERLGEPDRALAVWGQHLGERFLRDAFDTELQCLALNHMGRVHEGRKHYELAERALEQSLALNPRQPGVIQHWIHIRQKACKWPVYKPLPGISHSEMLRCTSPLAMLALVDDPLQQLLTAQSFVNRTYPVKEEWLCDRRRVPGARWRVGLVSADLREHAVGFLVPAFIQGLDRSQYELHAYDYSGPEDTPLRRQLRASFDRFTDISGLSDRQAAQAIAADGIDVLVDLHGLSAGARPGIFALHPAPRQLTYLGYMGSTGMPWFDHVIADPAALPPELASHFTEQPVHVSGSYLPLTLRKPAPLPVSRDAVGLPAGAFVMAAFGNVYKITEEMFASWMRLLRRIDGAVLWLIDDNPATTANLRQAALAHDVDPARLVFMPRCDHDLFCARLALADVYLDSYPYNCGSTSNDVINAGVPIVTLYGRSLVSRMGLSMLTELGLQDLATDSFAAYEDKVVEVALRRRAGWRLALVARPQPKLQAVLDTLRHGTRPAGLLQPPAAPASPRFEIRTLQPEASASGWLALHRAVRQVLVHGAMDERRLYGFHTPALQAATGLDLAGLERLLGADAPAADVVTASPGWDRHCLYRNPFLAEAGDDEAWLATAQAFADHCRAGLDLRAWVLPAHRCAHGLALFARKAVWFRWLEVAQKFADLAGEPAHPLGAQLAGPAGERLYPLLANLVLADDALTCRAAGLYALPAFTSRPAEIEAVAVECDALKQAWRHTGEARYLAQFDRLADLMAPRLREAG